MKEEMLKDLLACRSAQEFKLKADGSPDLENIKFSPSQDKWTLDMTYKVKGKASLSDEWQDVPDAGEPTFRFFKAEAVLP